MMTGKLGVGSHELPVDVSYVERGALVVFQGGLRLSIPFVYAAAEEDQFEANLETLLAHEIQSYISEKAGQTELWN